FQNSFSVLQRSRAWLSAEISASETSNSSATRLQRSRAWLSAEISAVSEASALAPLLQRSRAWLSAEMDSTRYNKKGNSKTSTEPRLVERGDSLPYPDLRSGRWLLQRSRAWLSAEMIRALTHPR